MPLSFVSAIHVGYAKRSHFTCSSCDFKWKIRLRHHTAIHLCRNIMLNYQKGKKVMQGRQAGFLNKALKYMENCNVLWEQSCECRSCFVTGQLLWQSDSRARERHDDAFEKSAMQTRNFHHSGLGSRERLELRRGSGCCCYVRACVGHVW